MFTEGEKNGNERRKKSEKEEMNERVILKVFFLYIFVLEEKEREEEVEVGLNGFLWFLLVFVFLIYSGIIKI